MQEIVRAGNGKEIIGGFKKILLMSVGKREGTSFRKNDQIREMFEGSPAFSEIFMELATNAAAGAEFVNGVIPRELTKQVEDSKAKLAQEMKDKINAMASVGTAGEEAALLLESVPVSEENLENIQAASAIPDFSSMTPEEFHACRSLRSTTRPE
jgi:hypothetical protein